MELISPAELVTLMALAAGFAVYESTRFVKSLSRKPIEPLMPPKSRGYTTTACDQAPLRSRSLRKLLEKTSKRCVVTYGTETGTAERLAMMFSRSAKMQFGMDCLVINLNDFDYDDLATLGPEYAIVLFLASAGEGEPTHDASRFVGHLGSAGPCNTANPVHYSIFGLGSTSYRLFNEAAKSVNEKLLRIGASRLGELGLGDDGKGTLEEDFFKWKDDTLPALANLLGYQPQAEIFEPIWEVRRYESTPSRPVLSGEPNRAQLYGKIKGPFTSRNPFPAHITTSREVTQSAAAKRCLHIEFDTSQSTLSYITGDHLGVLPLNPEVEVDRFMKVFGLGDDAEIAFDVTTKDDSVQPPFRDPTTFRAAVRGYVDICGPVSRQLLKCLAQLATSGSVRAYLLSLVDDAQLYTKEVKQPHLNISQLLETKTPPGMWTGVDFALLLEHLAVLKPRYYSISSSNMVSPKKISVTVVENTRMEEGWDFAFRGVSTDFLHRRVPKKEPSVGLLPGTDAGHSLHTYIHVRPSQFRLPRKTSTPIIMIGPGTGVAPFRAFVQERARQSRSGFKVGKTILFFGCRAEDQDFLYRDEWTEMKKDFEPGVFEMYNAFSRAGATKDYVQERMLENAEVLRQLIVCEGACVYVCGNADKMARDVRTTMSSILSHASFCQGDAAQATAYITRLKSEKRWREDVW